MSKNHSFLHLRCRSSYSLAEGAIKIDDLIELTSSNNMPAIALTDNGNLFGALEFSLKAFKNGIQPIIGSILEIVIGEDNKDFKNNNVLTAKILLIAKNALGWKNLSIFPLL